MLGTVVAASLMDKAGRKQLMNISFAGATLQQHMLVSSNPCSLGFAWSTWQWCRLTQPRAIKPVPELLQHACQWRHITAPHSHSRERCLSACPCCVHRVPQLGGRLCASRIALWPTQLL